MYDTPDEDQQRATIERVLDSYLDEVDPEDIDTDVLADDIVIRLRDVRAADGVTAAAEDAHAAANQLARLQGVADHDRPDQLLNTIAGTLSCLEAPLRALLAPARAGGASQFAHELEQALYSLRQAGKRVRTAEQEWHVR